MVIAVSFTIAKTWQQPKCPSTDEWIDKVIYWYRQYSFVYTNIVPPLKRNEILRDVTTWMNHKEIMLSEISQKQKDKYCMTPLI